MLPFAVACVFAGVALVLAVGLCVAYVQHYADPHHRSRLATAAAVATLAVGACCVVLLPIDVFSVSSSVWGTRTPSSTSSSSSTELVPPIPISFVRITLDSL